MTRYTFTVELGDAEPGRAEIIGVIDEFRRFLLDQSVTHTFTNEVTPAKTGRITGYPIRLDNP